MSYIVQFKGISVHSVTGESVGGFVDQGALTYYNVTQPALLKIEAAVRQLQNALFDAGAKSA